MGKASRWFRGLLGLNKPDPNPLFSKKKWSFSRAHKKRRDPHKQPLLPTAAVAEAAVAAAQAAAAVVKLNGSTAGSGGCFNSRDAVCVNREEGAAVTIQSHFRAYLARRALRALKALIKLQALAKGYIFRKQFSEYLRQMQAVARAQARLQAGRVSNSEASNSITKSSGFNHNGSATRADSDDAVDQTKRRQLSTLKRNGLKSSSRGMSRRTSEQLYEQQQGSSTRIVPMDDGRTDKILEVDPGKPTLMYRHTFRSSHDLTDQSWSPQFYSASSKKGPLTPTKSGSYYLDHPSYMAYTESSKAKARSVSAPSQRFQEERSSTMNRYSVHGFGNNNESRVNSAQKVSSLHASFTSKAYPGSGRLDRMGMPVREVLGFTGGHWQRFY